jgi:hypothetical protein
MAFVFVTDQDCPVTAFKEPPAANPAATHGVRFTIRSLMIGVALVAGLLAVLPFWREALMLALLIGVPLVGLRGLLAQVPRHRPTWRYGIATAMLGFVILGAGWLWAREVTWYFQRHEGFLALNSAHRAHEHEFWCVDLPSTVTAVFLLLTVAALGAACVIRGRRDYLWIVLGYALALTEVWFALFAYLEVEGFLT